MVHSLQLYEGICEGAYPRQVVEDDAWIRVVRPAVESVIDVGEPIDVLVFLFELSLSLGCTKQLHVF